MKLIKFAQELNDKYKSNIFVSYQTEHILNLDDEEKLQNSFRNLLKEFDCEFKFNIENYYRSGNYAIKIYDNYQYHIDRHETYSTIFIYFYKINVNEVNNLLLKLDELINSFYKVKRKILSHLHCKCIICNPQNLNIYRISFDSSMDNNSYKYYQLFKKDLEKMLGKPGGFVDSKWYEDISHDYSIYFNLDDIEYQAVNDLALSSLDMGLEKETIMNPFKDIKI